MLAILAQVFIVFGKLLAHVDVVDGIGKPRKIMDLLWKRILYDPISTTTVVDQI